MLISRLAGLALLVGTTTALHTSAPASVASATVACTQTHRLLHSTPGSQARITVTYQDADIRDVLAAFARFTARTINVAKDVHGLVTTEIRDQPWDVGLQSILASQQLAASEAQNGTITVANCAKK